MGRYQKTTHIDSRYTTLYKQQQPIGAVKKTQGSRHSQNRDKKKHIGGMQ